MTDAYNAHLARVLTLQNSGNACVQCGGHGYTVPQSADYAKTKCEPCRGTGEAISPPCPTCQLPTGEPNAEYLHEQASCTFGCGAVIDMDHGMCEHCKEHSANHADCETCGSEFEDWDAGKWERVS